MRSKVHTVDTVEAKPKDPYNTAIAALLRARKAEVRTTFAAMESATGIKLRQLKILFSDERQLHLGEFISICTALDLDPAEVVQSAADRVEKTSA